MTDHRVTDLSHGHLGELSYDPDEHVWAWSRNLFNIQAEVLQPFDQYVQSSIVHTSDRSTKPSRIAREHLRWISKCHPEVFPAGGLSAAIGINQPMSNSDPYYQVGDLLAVGHAVDHEGISGSHKPQIVAMPCGEAGHILRLIRPRFQSLGWGTQSSVQLRMMGADVLDRGHWTSTGGRILQISFAEDINGSSTLFAVRQSNMTTIFRPIYGKVPDVNHTSTGFSQTSSKSGISPNPVAILTRDMLSSRHHVDISFNPWYSRQFAIVDGLGSWSIFDIEGQLTTAANVKIVLAKVGNIYENNAATPFPGSCTLKSKDGWHTVIWCSSVTTVVICDRRNLVVFDVKATPERIGSYDILAKNSLDAILDMKRSATDLNHLFILTTLRVFWIEVVSVGDDNNGKSRANAATVLLSCRHYRDRTDQTLKLAVANNERVSVIISSGKSPILSLYYFVKAGGNTRKPRASQTSLRLPSPNSEASVIAALQTVHFLPVFLKSSSTGQIFKPGFRYIKEGFQFYQILALAPNLRLLSTLCAAGDDANENTHHLARKILAPETVLSRRFNHASSRYVSEDSFIVPDDLDLDSALYSVCSSQRERGGQRVTALISKTDDLRLRMDWSYLCQRIFSYDVKASSNKIMGQQHDAMAGISKIFRTIRSQIATRAGSKPLGMRTFYELSRGYEIVEDLEQVASSMEAFMEELQQHQDVEVLRLTLLNLNLGQVFQPNSSPGIMETYDHLVTIWIASLPLETSSLARLSKFHLVRQLALDLHLSSMAVCYQNLSATTDTESTESSPYLKIRETQSRDDQPDLSSLSRTPQMGGSSGSLPTPAQILSINSSKSISENEVHPDDPAIARLRRYAISIASRPSIGRPTLLSHWPEIPGSDPGEYLWDADNGRTMAADGGVLRDYDTRRGEARRRTRTENLMRRDERLNTEASSASGFGQASSQPNMAQHVLSSQNLGEQPMSQPDRGVFGSRSFLNKTKRQKQQKRRAAGF